MDRFISIQIAFFALVHRSSFLSMSVSYYYCCSCCCCCCYYYYYYYDV